MSKGKNQELPYNLLILVYCDKPCKRELSYRGIASILLKHDIHYLEMHNGAFGLGLRHSVNKLSSKGNKYSHIKSVDLQKTLINSC